MEMIPLQPHGVCHRVPALIKMPYAAMFNLQVGLQLGRPFGHIVNETLPFARHDTKRRVRQLEASRLALVVQYRDAAELSSLSTL